MRIFLILILIALSNLLRGLVRSYSILDLHSIPKSAPFHLDGFQPRVQEAVHREDVSFEKLKVWIRIVWVVPLPSNSDK